MYVDVYKYFAVKSKEHQDRKRNKLKTKTKIKVLCRALQVNRSDHDRNAELFSEILEKINKLNLAIVKT